MANMKKTTFHFKTEKIKDATGAVISEGRKLPSLEVDIPVPSIEDLQTFLSDPENFKAEVALLFAACEDQVFRIARGQLNAFREKNPDSEVTQAALNYEALSWTAIANMPPSERSSSVPSDEDVKAFLDVYVTVMPSALNKTTEQINNHVGMFQSAFKKHRAFPEILEYFRNCLAVFATTVAPETLDEHGDVVSYFTNRLTKMIEANAKPDLNQF